MATITVTPGYTFDSGETVEANDLNLLGQPTATITNIVNADIASGAAIALSKLATGALPTAITVSSANMVTATAQALLPAGAVMPFARSTKPAGWLEANGNVVPNGTGTVQGVTADFSALYAAVGTSFGAAGTLPNLQGIFVRGSGSQTISGTAYSGTFAAKQQDAFQEHRHSQIPSSIGSGGSGVSGTGSSLTGNVTGTAVEVAGSGFGVPRTASETRPANIALLYCIKF